MIRKQDVIDRATEWQLRPEVVEKDYVLGWLLASLAAEPIRDTWVFKGGTSIKKCYFETYRFSEDLDFSLLPGAAYTAEAIREALLSLTRRAEESSGIQFPEDRVEVRAVRNKQGQLTFQARAAYAGPLAYPGPPRVLFDITQHERVLEEPAARSVFHPYPDPLPEGATVATYSFNEILAEKTRALYERTRPRDLYDVVFLLDNQPEAFDLPKVRKLFAEKCNSKGLPVPDAAKLLQIAHEDAELASEWANMLGHQLPALPHLGDLLARLPDLLAWVDAPGAVLPRTRLIPYPASPGETQIASAGIQYWGQRIPLESIRFAGANRLMIEFDYNGVHRVVEPYSLRRAGTGNVLLYAWELGSTHVKAFNTGKMENLITTNKSFSPRYQVEFSAGGGVEIPESMRRTPSRRGLSSGTKYVFECLTCQKRFTRRSNSPSLGKHKAKGSSWSCPGSMGFLVEIR
ncbi:MAG TPA: nucleotidyl transferase AbiEii/AbiGii toxin family protein [Candidatus Polarisedimenticolia bacterium]|jgi:predicted nucleotidyltransferase component of viral defense system|nr:nucleotidyl transferase AbiEii/AbiGii toxin family protein [Candidatus Polarisedimenticolia bacterium]